VTSRDIWLKFLASAVISSGPLSGSDSFVIPFPIAVVACESTARGLLILDARIKAVIKASTRAVMEIIKSAKGGRAPILSF